MFDFLDLLGDLFRLHFVFLQIPLRRLVSLVVSSVLVASRSLSVRHGGDFERSNTFPPVTN